MAAPNAYRVTISIVRTRRKTMQSNSHIQAAYPLVIVIHPGTCQSVIPSPWRKGVSMGCTRKLEFTIIVVGTGALDGPKQN